jgi:hypothetical protein
VSDEFAVRKLRSRLAHERESAGRHLIRGMRVLRDNLENNIKRFEAGEQVDAHLISNFVMLTYEIARWNMMLELIPFLEDDSATRSTPEK